MPCAPVNVNTTLSCSNNDLMVSWKPASVPLNYSVTAVPLAGDVTSVTCHTDSSNCTLSGLHCGQTYNVSVKASSGNCTGAYSIPQTVQTGKIQDLSIHIFSNFDNNFFTYCAILPKDPAPLRVWQQWQTVAQTPFWPPGTPLLEQSHTEQLWQAPTVSLKPALHQTSHVLSVAYSVPVSTLSP